MLKRCSTCRVEKELVEFGRHVSTKDGLRGACKRCLRKPPRPAVCLHCSLKWDHKGRGPLPKLCGPCEETLSWCHQCKVAKPHDRFHVQALARTGRSSKCGSCTHANSITDRGRARARAAALKRNYGITVAEFDQRLIDQRGLCACCERQLNEHLVVDHDHDSGVVRGILCFGCNTGLGQLGDNAEGAHRAETYLWAHRDILAEFASGRHSAQELIGVGS